MRALLAACVLAALLAAGSSSAQVGLFAYDASAPLAVREAAAVERDGVRLVELSYASPRGGRVPATLVLPTGEGRHPAVVFQHGGGNARRSDYLAEAEELARAGLAALLVDAPFNRPGARPWLTFTAADRAAYVQNVVDLRRAIDLLRERPEVEPERIALVGHSYGGVLAGIVAGVDRRLAAVVVMSGPGRITDPLRQEGRRLRLPARRLDAYIKAMRAVDAVPYVGRATAPLYFQFGRRDAMPAAWFRAYVAAAPRGARVQWYPAGHGLCDCATRDRRAWLLARLAAGRTPAAAATGDVGRFVSGLARAHPDPFHAVSRAQLTADAQRLDRASRSSRAARHRPAARPARADRRADVADDLLGGGQAGAAPLGSRSSPTAACR